MTELESAQELVAPVMVAAFEGWNDAGNAASGTVNHLVSIWETTEIAALDPEDYHDFQVNRPSVMMRDGQRVITWPTTRLSVARPSRSASSPERGAVAPARDIVLVQGIEPNIRWRTYCAELIDHAKRLSVDMVVTLGALLSDAPHSRPVPVSGTAADATVRSRLGFEPSQYEGPTGIVGVFHDACATAGVDAVSLWAAVPHYVGSAPCPKATIALLRRVEDLLDLSVPLGSLPAEAKQWQERANELVEEDQDVADYVRQLEESTDTADLPEASGEFIAREFESYLRRRHEQE